jgi:putative nucleotidyltransferase with HDIG domain
VSRTTAELRSVAVEQFAHCLVNATLNRDLHDAGSSHVRTAIEALIGALRQAVQVGVELPLRLQLGDDCIFHDGVPLEGPSLQARRLLQQCDERQIAAIAFDAPLTAAELLSFLDLLLLPQNRPSLSRKNRERALSALGIRNVSITSRIPGDPADRRVAVVDETRHTALLRYQDLADVLQQNHVRAHRDQELALDATSGIVERAILQLDNEPSGLLALAAQDSIDRFTVGHSVRVALLALQVARAAGADRNQLVRIGTAALLHDIGKSKVPQEILFKQGRLDDEEWRWMAQHPRLGAQILIEQQELDASVVGAAFCHHMRPVGEGYPRPAVPFQPSGTSRLVRVCDVFEALTSVRPYKRALTPCEAFAVMCREERDFDQRWLRFFVRTLGLYPQGTRLLLDDGSEAMVARQTACPYQPVVQPITGPAGGSLPPGTPTEITVGVPHAGQVRRVASVRTSDRLVVVPEGDVGEPVILTQTVHGACLPPSPPSP